MTITTTLVYRTDSFEWTFNWNDEFLFVIFEVDGKEASFTLPWNQTGDAEKLAEVFGDIKVSTFATLVELLGHVSRHRDALMSLAKV